MLMQYPRYGVVITRVLPGAHDTREVGQKCVSCRTCSGPMWRTSITMLANRTHGTSSASPLGNGLGCVRNNQIFYTRLHAPSPVSQGSLCYKSIPSFVTLCWDSTRGTPLVSSWVNDIGVFWEHLSVGVAHKNLTPWCYVNTPFIPV